MSTADSDQNWRRGMRAPPARPPRGERRPPKPPPPPPKPVYVAPPAPWQGQRQAPVDFRSLEVVSRRPPSPPQRPPPQSLPPQRPPANPWGAPVRPAASLGGDFPALRQAPLVLRPSVEVKPPPTKKGFLKPKPQRNFVVFDVLAAKKKKKKPVKAPPKPKVVIQTPPPRLAPGKVRKKRLSSLKKRILLERQEKYYQLHPEMRPAASVREEVPWEAFSDATGLEKRFVVRAH